MEKKPMDMRIVKYIFLTGAVVLAILHFEGLLQALAKIADVASPLILGAVIAYILNIVMKKVEQIYFPGSRKPIVQKTRRMVSILASILLILAVLALVMTLVVPELIKAISVVVSGISLMLERAETWILTYEDQLPLIVEWVQGIDVDWEGTLRNVLNVATTGVGEILNSTVTAVTTLMGGVADFVVALIFAIYILAGKERLERQFHRLMRAYLKKERVEKIEKLLRTANETFSNFIVGQCTEAVILGVLCTVSMWILRFPYAPMVGALLGVTALIPIVGAFIGAGVGAFMILTVDPMKALLFLLFIVILQQLEGNLIYPKVVGSSIGLPGIWVLAGVTVGGGIGGIVGMLLGVPLTATLYKLIRQDTAMRTGASGEKAKRI